MKQEIYAKQLKNLSITQAMEMYGQRMREVNGQLYVDTGFADLSNVMEIVEFKVLPQGCETWIKGEKYPVRGCFNSKTAIVHQFKRLAPILIKTLQGGIIRKIVGVIYLKLNWEKFVDFVHDGLRNVIYPEPSRYQQPVIEVYKVIKNKKLRDIICSVLEMDDAYRYMFQDIVGELNKDRFERNPSLELRRLVKIYRERSDDPRSNIEKAVKYLCFYLKFDKKLLKELQEIVKQLDISQIVLSPEDKHWTNKWHAYKFGGLSLQERQKI